jgi:DNA-directed DNA polymerase III PolC
MYLNCHTYYSFLYGTLKLKDLLQQARALGIERLVVTDINNTSACIEIMRLIDKEKVNDQKELDPVLGIDFRNESIQQFVGIAKNANGFQQLNRLLSAHLKSKAPFPDRCIPLDDVYIVYPFHHSKSYNNLQSYEYIGVRPQDLHYLSHIKWKYKHAKMVILHTVTFGAKQDIHLHQLLRCIDENTILSKVPKEQALAEEVLLDESDFYNLYQDYPKLLENTSKLLYNCEIIDFNLKQTKNKLTLKQGVSEEEALRQDFNCLKKLAYDGAKERYKGLFNQEIEDRINKELNLIKHQQFVAYFLINYDIISYARKQGFYYIGRGSGANSVVAYCLKITDVDPIELDLYFERFINLYRQNPPDFDIDFSWQDRDQIIQYIFDTYGVEHTCLQATYTTFQLNSALRELGKVYGLPTAEIEEMLAMVKEGKTKQLEMLQKEIVFYADKLIDFPRNLSIHASGILISSKPIYTYTATSHPPKGFPICQFDMHNAEDLGLYKFDILSQRGLGHIKDTLQIVKENKGVEIDIHQIADFMKDDHIIQHLKKGNLLGCFYVESPAMRMLLAKLRCEDYLTLVAASSIIRPGVAQSGMMREYVLRHHLPDHGESRAHPTIWDIMPDTYGVMVYQEDVIKVAHIFAGLDLGEADVLRRGMSGKYRSRDEFQQVKNKFFENCERMGHALSLASEIWRQIESFAGYSFAKGHSASFAVESYQSMYLKAHFPLEFMVGVINNFGGFYKTEFYVHEAKKAGAKVEAPCVNKSEYLTIIEGETIYLGLIHIGGLEKKLVEQILDQRESFGAFKDLADFIDRLNIGLEQLIILVRIAAFRFTGKTKQMLLWEAHFLINKQQKKTIEAKLFVSSVNHSFNIPNLYHDIRNDMLDELEILGFTISSPFDLMADQSKTGIKAKDIPLYVNQEVQIIGRLVTVKYIKTIRREIMNFATFLDQEGNWIDAVLFPDVAARFRFKGLGCYFMKGKITQEFGFFTLEISHIEKMAWWNAAAD